MIFTDQKNVLFLTSLSHFIVHSTIIFYPTLIYLFVEEFKIEIELIGFIYMISNFFFGFGSLFSGYVENRYGEKKLLLIFQIGSFFSCFFIIFSQSFISFAFFHILLCVFLSIYHPAGLTLISRRTNYLSKAMSYHGIAGSLGLAFGPILSSLLTTFISWRYAYFLAMLIFLFLFFITLISLEVKTDKNIITSKRKFFRKKLILFYLINCLAGIAFSSFLTYMPIFFTIKLINLNFVPILIGGVFTTLVLLAGIPGQLLGGFIGEKFKKSSIIMILCILHIPLLIIIPLLNGYFLIFYSLILGFINFIFQPIGNSIIADYTSSNERGFAYGFSFFLGFGIGSLGSGIGGILLSNWNISLVFYFAACMMILSIIPSLLLLKVDKKDN
ncbi:MAG: hypothetical protein CMG48_02725 [Candidatus Marinimicrobia bacterium]|nr:hypothetical protein [Candidatus Neomarinimicrobiota bacterium]